MSRRSNDNGRRRRRAWDGMASAADQQPWRCVACGEAISYVRRNPCQCIPAPITAALPEEK